MIQFVAAGAVIIWAFACDRHKPVESVPEDAGNNINRVDSGETRVGDASSGRDAARLADAGLTTDGRSLADRYLPIEEAGFLIDATMPHDSGLDGGTLVPDSGNLTPDAAVSADANSFDAGLDGGRLDANDAGSKDVRYFDSGMIVIDAGIVDAGFFDQDASRIMGEIDLSFGNNGVVIDDAAAGGVGSHEFGYNIAMDISGKIIIVGQSSNSQGNEDMVLWRYNPDGTKDLTFGINGVVVHHNAAGGDLHDNGWSVRLDSTGRILVSGRSQNDRHDFDMVIWRFSSDGTIDTSFGNGGRVVHDSAAGGHNYDSGYSMVLDALGRVLVGGGSINASGNSDMVIWRYDNNGVLDTTFGDSGIVVHANALGENAAERATSIAIDLSDRILTAGYGVNLEGNSDLPIWRFNQNGTIDTGFGRNGFLVQNNIAGGNGHDSGGCAIDQSGRLYAGGASQNSSGNYDMFILRFSNNGEIDPGFGNNGVVIYDNAAGGNGDDGATALAFDSEGQPYVCGFSQNQNGDKDVIVWRYHTNGMIDTTFGTGGVFRYHDVAGGNGDDQCLSIKLDLSGRVMVSGYSLNARGNYDMFILKIK